jgi:hypothetical protein
MDMTSEARMNRAVRIVRQQRDEHPGDLDSFNVGDCEWAIEQLDRLQAAVMGELPPDDIVILEEDLLVTWYRAEGQLAHEDPVGVTILHKPSGITVRQSKLASRLANADDAMRKLRLELRERNAG